VAQTNTRQPHTKKQQGRNEGSNNWNQSTGGRQRPKWLRVGGFLTGDPRITPKIKIAETLGAKEQHRLTVNRQQQKLLPTGRTDNQNKAVPVSSTSKIQTSAQEESKQLQTLPISTPGTIIIRARSCKRTERTSRHSPNRGAQATRQIKERGTSRLNQGSERFFGCKLQSVTSPHQ
jgi:hypothetical protein